GFAAIGWIFRVELTRNGSADSAAGRNGDAVVGRPPVHHHWCEAESFSVVAAQEHLFRRCVSFENRLTTVREHLPTAGLFFPTRGVGSVGINPFVQRPLRVFGRPCRRRGRFG